MAPESSSGAFSFMFWNFCPSAVPASALGSLILDLLSRCLDAPCYMRLLGYTLRLGRAGGACPGTFVG